MRSWPIQRQICLARPPHSPSTSTLPPPRTMAGVGKVSTIAPRRSLSLSRHDRFLRPAGFTTRSISIGTASPRFFWLAVLFWLDEVAQAVRRRVDPRERDAAPGKICTVPAADAAARHHGQLQPHRFCCDHAGADEALRWPAVPDFRSCPKRRDRRSRSTISSRKPIQKSH